MTKTRRTNTKFLLLTAGLSALALGACTPQATTYYPGRSGGPSPVAPEVLLDADDGHMVEEEENLSPLQAHMKARKMVKPGDLGKTHKYTSTAPAPSESSHVRIVRMDEESDLIAASQNAPAPEYTAGDTASFDEGQADLQTDIQAEPDSDMVVPGIKPRREDRAAAPVVEAAADTSGVPLPTVKPDRRRAEAENTASQPEETDAAPAPTNTNGASVTGLRIGKHGPTTRLVLDLSSGANFKHVISSDRTAIVIKIPQTEWAASIDTESYEQGLISSYAAKTTKAGDVMLTVTFRNPFTVVMAKAFPPEEGKGDRIVFDFEENK